MTQQAHRDTATGRTATADADWLASITAELRGRDPERALWWTLPDRFDVSAARGPADAPTRRPPLTIDAATGPWSICTMLDATGPDELVAEAAESSRLGADTLGIRVGPGGWAETDLDVLADCWADARVLRHVRAGPFAPDIVDRLLDRDVFLDRGTTDLDPVALVLRFGDVDEDRVDDWASSAVQRFGERAATFHPLCADGLVAHRAGATGVTESALVLASVSRWMDALVHRRGLPADAAARALHVRTSADALYFPSVARLRALRTGLLQVLAAYGVSDAVAARVPIHVHTTPRRIAAFDRNTNLLRATTAAAAAVVAGCDALWVTPPDAAARPTRRGRDLALAVQTLLRDESHLHAVADPSAGSWYVESLTDDYGRRSWNLFAEIDTEGPVAALRSGVLAARIREEATHEESAFDGRRLTMLGVNRRCVPDEPPPDVMPRPAVLADGRFVPSGAPGAPVGFRRPSARLEALRSAFRAARSGDDRSKPALLLMFGDAATAGAHAAAATDVLGCAGVAAAPPTRCDDVQSIEQVLEASDSPIVVLCAPDADMATIGRAARTVRDRGVPDFTLVAWGRPPDDRPDAWHVDVCMHDGMALLTALTDVLTAAGLQFEAEDA